LREFKSERPDLRLAMAALLPLALALATVAASFLVTHGLPALGFVLSRAFFLICHQRPERSFWIFGAQVAVCARCLGVYLGAAIGLMFRTSRRVALRLLAAAAVFNLADAAAELSGLHGNLLAVRFALGIWLGAAAGTLISAAVLEQRRTVSGTPPA
jgi:uncharacterized membrane protein